MICIKEALFWAARNCHSFPVYDRPEQTRRYRDFLDSGIPFVAGKIGGNELWALRTAEFGYWRGLDLLWDHMTNEAGFFYDGGKREGIERFAECLRTAISQMDFAQEWQKPKEYYFYKKLIGKMPELVDFLGVDDAYPWTKVLKGRKVLVIHPFMKSILYQYEKREVIYRNPEVLPEMKLSVMKAIQTEGGNPDSRFNNWFEALDYMTKEALTYDFDVALVGCGAYGLPLCANIKKSGRSAIHMGSYLQLLFGITGKRWENEAFINRMKTEAWKRPFPEEIPDNYEKVEGGCYW